MAVADAQELRRLIDVVESKLASLPTIDHDDLDSVTRFHIAAKDALLTINTDDPAAIKIDWRGAEMRLGGVSSSSTSGAAGVMRNWLKAARRRLEVAS